MLRISAAVLFTVSIFENIIPLSNGGTGLGKPTFRIQYVYSRILNYSDPVNNKEAIYLHQHFLYNYIIKGYAT